MRDSRFKELVNIYLDNEITEQQLLELSGELKTDSTRRRKFKSFYRLHKATCAVLNKSEDPIHIRSVENRQIWNFSFATQFAIGTACLLIAFTIFIPFFSRKTSVPVEGPISDPVHAFRSFRIEESLVSELDPSNLKAKPLGSDFFVSHSNLDTRIGNSDSINLFSERFPVNMKNNQLLKHGFRNNFPSVFYEERKKQSRYMPFQTERNPRYDSKLARFRFQR